MPALVLQKMDSILEKLWASMACYPSELSAELTERERFKEQLQAALTNQPISALNNVLSCELERKSAAVHSRKTILQVGLNIHCSDCYIGPVGLLVSGVSQNMPVTHITK